MLGGAQIFWVFVVLTARHWSPRVWSHSASLVQSTGQASAGRQVFTPPRSQHRSPWAMLHWVSSVQSRVQVSWQYPVPAGSVDAPLTPPVPEVLPELSPPCPSFPQETRTVTPTAATKRQERKDRMMKPP